MTGSVSMPETLSLLGKSAIVTGGARGIGAATALELAKRGANVALGYTHDSSTSQAKKIAAQIEALGCRSAIVQYELSNKDAGEAILDSSLKGLGVDKIDILVNNAGADHKPGLCTTTDMDDFERIMHVNVRAPMLLVSALVKHLPEKGGRIISISSTQARQPAAEMALYSSSKAALECLSKYWAAELGRKYKLTSNVVQVAVVETEYFENHPEPVKEALRELPSAERRLGQVGDISEIVAFLASDSARWINGDTIAGNGGSTFM